MNVTSLKYESKSNFTLILAPPGWGKTSMLLDLFEQSNSDKLWLFFSPLRALNEEFYERVSKSHKAWFFSSKAIGNNKYQSRTLPRVIVMSPEVFESEWFYKWQKEKEIGIIIDEVHLFFKWGETFRPRLLDFLFQCLSLNTPIVGLSATVDKKLSSEMRNLVEYNRGNFEEINYGNFQFLNSPKKRIVFHDKDRFILNRYLIYLIKKYPKKKILIFCQRRNEVEQWLSILKKMKVDCLGAVGGSVEQFREQLKRMSHVQVIVSTSCLGHGVNLPSIDYLAINYDEMDYALWLQMATRAGRRGEEFSVLYCKKLKGLKKIFARINAQFYDYHFQLSKIFERMKG